MRKLAYLAAISFLLCLSSSAQERTTTDVSLGYSYIRANPATSNSPDFNIHGGTASVALNPKSWFGIASRVSAKPAMQGHFKTGHSRPGTLDVVPIGDLSCKSHF